MHITLINAILAGATLATSIRAAGALRFHTLVRSYAASALFLGLFVAGLAFERNAPELYLLAATAIALKALIIPAVITRAADRAGMSMRLSSTLRPAPTYIVITVLITVVTAMALRSPFAAGADPE